MKTDLTESIEWVNTLPPTWNVKRLDALAIVKARLGWKGLKAEEYVEEGYIFLSTPNLKGDDIDFENVNYITKARYDESPEIMLREGDVLMVKDGATLGIVALVKSLPAPATVNGSTAVIRSTNDCDSRFLYHWLRSQGIQQLIEKMKGGMGVPHLFQSDLRRFPVALPPIPDQQRIAAYLDEQTEKIDRLMDMRRRQMALLKEQRSALIQQAVTRGLNPNVPMKDSGLPWLGEIPEHWEIVCLKHLCSHIVDCLHATPDYTDDGEYPAIRTADIEPGVMHITKAKKLRYTDYLNQIQRLAPKGGDIVYSREGERFGIAACVPPNVDLCISQRMMHFRCRSENSSEFIMWQLNTHTVYIQALQCVFGATSPHINVETVRNYLLTEPPLSEQREIVAFINAETQKTDRLLLAYHRQLTLLTEYRAALIHECVTGQRLLPEATSP